MNLDLIKSGLKISSKEELELAICGNNIDFSKVCRTCLKETADNSLANDSLCIISSMGKLVRFQDMFESATGIKIDLNDGLPLNICSPCLQSINNSYNFRTQSQSVNEILVNIHNSLIDSKNNSNDKDDNEEEEEEEDHEAYLDDVLDEFIEETKHISDEQLEDQSDPVESNIKETTTSNQNVKTESIELFNDEEVHYEVSLEGESIEDNQAVSEYEIEIDYSKKISDDDTRAFCYSCKYCSEIFPIQRDLFKHYRKNHPTEKPFECEQCSTTFVHIQSMRRHKKIHRANNKEQMCPLCSRLFSRSDDLNRHLRVHTDERPYPCSICKKAFKQHTELKDHMFSHREGKMFKCELCNKEWRSRNGWYMHMKSHQEGSSGTSGRKKKVMECVRSLSSIIIVPEAASK